jgi:hypothetical protein
MEQQFKNMIEALQWMLDDMTDTGEDKNPETGDVYDSVAKAQTALAEAKEYLDREDRQIFLNGFDSWQETHYEIVSFIARQSDSIENKDAEITQTSYTLGTGGLYDLAKAWTDEFEITRNCRIWDGEFFDEIELYCQIKNRDFKFNHKRLTEQVKEGIINLGAHYRFTIVPKEIGRELYSDKYTLTLHEQERPDKISTIKTHDFSGYRTQEDAERDLQLLRQKDFKI